MPDAARRSSAVPASVHGRFEPGTRLGTRYRIVGLLGRGGMGEVYRADDLELGQSVALKFISERVAGDPIALDRFRGEVRNARKIAHPNVCRMYDIGEVDGHVFLSMEYIDGEDLAHVLARMGRPSQEKALEIARQLCLGLAAAHENGVLHRDLKPANIMIDGRGRVRITDFGLAGLADELDTRRERVGTPAYMAPEQLEDGKVSVRSDIHALGLVLHEVFTGRRVYHTNDVAELKKLHSSGSVSTPSSGTHEIDPAVERIIERCLERDPQQRPQSVYVVLGALPGMDPLAAALAAGETPSPDLVANARDAGGLRPPIAVGLLVTILAFQAITYFYYAGTTIMPERSPAELSVVAKQVMEELGHTNLPRNSVSGYDVNNQLSESLRSSPRPYDEVAELPWPPRFRYWRRWTDGVFSPIDFHLPEIFDIDGPIRGSRDSATVAFDSTGRLLGLRVAMPPPEGSSKSVGDADWSPVFRRANLDESNATPIPLVKSPPVYCDEVVAWRMDGTGEGGDPVRIQMGAVGGRPNYFEILGLDKAMTVPWDPSNIEILWTIFEILIIILAWRNLRASRGDRRNAFRSALIMGVLYALMELLAIRLGEADIPDHIRALLNGHAAGHVILHAFQVWLIYMAIEPYVRRIWPRMLVGFVRLLSGRVRDPAVGREVLIGVVTGCGLVAVVAMMSFAEWRIHTDNTGRPPFWMSVQSMISPGYFVTSKLHIAAGAMLDAAYFAGYIIILRFLTRYSLAAIVLAVVFIGWCGSNWLLSFVGGSMWLAFVYAAFFGVAMVLLCTKVGVLAVIIAVFVARMSGAIMIDFDTWFAPYGMAELAILLALAAYGFWVSLAGQPLFKDMLIAEKPARA